MENLLSSVDLLPHLDEVDSQGSTNACAGISIAGALDCLHYRAGRPKKFSAAWLWWWARVHKGKTGENVGTGFPEQVRTLAENGAVLESEWPWANANIAPTKSVAALHGIELVSTNIAGVQDIKRLLCLGIPVLYAFNTSPSFYALHDQQDWKTHSWSGGSSGYHMVCIVGYDDSCQRFLCENSYGPQWGDGGFFGMPYSTYSAAMEYVAHIDKVPGLPRAGVQGFDMKVYWLNAMDNSDHSIKQKPQLVRHLQNVFETNGLQALINECVAWGVSDKYLEWLMGWDRWTVETYKNNNPDLDWSNLTWAQA